MDNDLLNSCSEKVQPAIEHLDAYASPVDKRSRLNAIIYYVLDQVDSTRVQKFLSEWHEENYDPGLMVFEVIDNLVYLLKLEKKHNPETWDQKESLQRFAAILKSEQTVDGAFKISDYDHVGGLWFMTHFAPDTEITQNAVNYFVSDMDFGSPETYHYWQDISLGSIALAELDVHLYGETVSQLGDKIKENLPSRLETYREKRSEGEHYTAFENILPYILIALNRIPANYPDLNEEVVQLIGERLSRENFEELPNRKIARMTMGLIANGEGPKIPASTAEWEKERKMQRVRYSKPEFVSTLPTTRLQTRRKEIHNRCQDIINDVDNELRISTLRIDMLYNDIIELVHDTEVDVKILSRQESPSDDRKRIKKAVINELIKETNDEVRGDDLIHARMIIGDHDEMLVSSADITRDQLYDEFNAGIYTRDSQAISNAIEIFDKVWTDAGPLGIIQ